MSARTVIHYQVKLQTPLCYNGRAENVTFELPKVTCRNCLEKKRREQSNKGIDWKAIGRDLMDKLSGVDRAVKEFCFAHNYRGTVTTGQYPPRILIQFYVPATTKRKRTVAHNIGPTLSKPNYIQVSVLTTDNLDICAAFIGEIAETLGLKPWREHTQSESVLNYELRPYYNRK